MLIPGVVFTERSNTGSKIMELIICSCWWGFWLIVGVGGISTVDHRVGNWKQLRKVIVE